MTERDITRALKAAPTNRGLWERFYRALHPQIVRSVFRLSGGDSDLAREAAQDAFTRFAEYNSLDRVTDDESALAFLRQIARRFLIDRSRKTAHEKGGLGALEHARAPLDEATVAWAAEEARLERLHDLSVLAKGISAEDQRILGLLLDGEPLVNIAKLQGVTYNALVVRLHRIRRRLTNISQHSKK